MPEAWGVRSNDALYMGINVILALFHSLDGAANRMACWREEYSQQACWPPEDARQLESLGSSDGIVSPAGRTNPLPGRPGARAWSAVVPVSEHRRLDGRRSPGKRNGLFQAHRSTPSQQMFSSAGDYIKRVITDPATTPPATHTCPAPALSAVRRRRRPPPGSERSPPNPRRHRPHRQSGPAPLGRTAPG